MPYTASTPPPPPPPPGEKKNVVFSHKFWKISLPFPPPTPSPRFWLFSTIGPPFCTCSPPFDPPPPPVWDLRNYRLWWRSEKKCCWGTCATLDAGGAPRKKVLESPPPRSSAFGDLHDFRGWRRSRKKKGCPPPPLFWKSWIRPCIQCANCKKFSFHAIMPWH